jgi:hypothetical protein
MTHTERKDYENHRWALGIILAVMLQALAFSYWAGRLAGTVAALQDTVNSIRVDLSAHVNKP